jgi:hypothetical protein
VKIVLVIVWLALFGATATTATVKAWRLSKKRRWLAGIVEKGEWPVGK